MYCIMMAVLTML